MLIEGLQRTDAVLEPQENLLQLGLASLPPLLAREVLRKPQFEFLGLVDPLPRRVVLPRFAKLIRLLKELVDHLLRFPDFRLGAFVVRTGHRR